MKTSRIKMFGFGSQMKGLRLKGYARDIYMLVYDRSLLNLKFRKKH